MRALAVALLVAAGRVLADDEDAAALAVADQTPTTSTQARDWHAFVEPALGMASVRTGDSPLYIERLSFDGRYESSFASGWRAVVADRLDLVNEQPLLDQQSANTLKEAYLSWQPRSNLIFDLGRVNLHNGVAYGYNPTDYFKVNAIRSIVSIDPASLKENRLGSVMLNGQALWTGGSVSALYSPKLASPVLADAPSNSTFSPMLGATNAQNRWLVTASQRLSDKFSPQCLLYGVEQASPQLGCNLTALLSDASVAYLEWSGGRSPSLLSQATGGPDDTAYRNRVATGLTYTTSSKLSLTLEYEYNGAGMDLATWNALSHGPPDVFRQFGEFIVEAQEPPTKQSIFFYAHWQDALVLHLDLSAMQRYDVATNSGQSWLEARYHWDRVELALQWQLNAGAPGSVYGSLPAQQVWQALVKYFF